MIHKLILIKLSIQLPDIWTDFGILTIFTEMQLNNSTDTEAPVLDSNLSISKGVISSTIYDKRGVSEFDMNYFPFVDSDVPRSSSYDGYFSHPIRFARMSNHLADCSARNKTFTVKYLQEGYRYHKLWKALSSTL